MIGGDQRKMSRRPSRTRRATQRLGRAWPPRVAIRTNRSGHRSFHAAARIPRGSEKRTDRSTVYPVRSSVTGSWRPIIEVMGSLLSRECPPNCPFTMLQSHRPYWMWRGSFRPSSSRSDSRTSGLTTTSPAMTRAMSPGSTRMIRKTTMDAPSTVGTMRASLQAMYRLMISRMPAWQEGPSGFVLEVAQSKPSSSCCPAKPWRSRCGCGRPPSVWPDL